jgi:hypothetical protein
MWFAVASRSAASAVMRAVGLVIVIPWLGMWLLVPIVFRLGGGPGFSSWAYVGFTMALPCLVNILFFDWARRRLRGAFA